MTETYTKGNSESTWIFLGNMSLGGRLASGIPTSIPLDLDDTYTFNKLWEIRADISDWSGPADNFTGAYLRFSTSEKTTDYNLRGMELNVASTTSVVNLSGLYSETQCKTLAANSTWTSVRGIEANLSFYDQGKTVAVTEAGCIYATIGLGSGYTAYTGIHGLVIETRDGSTGTRTIGSGIVLRNISPAEGTQTFTKGIQIAMAALTGISLEGLMTTGILFSGAVTRGINFLTGTVAPGSAHNAAFCIGQRGGTAHTVTLTAAADLHFNPMQFNVAVGGVNPSNTATWNMIYQSITHATADMANLRLKCADWTINASKNVQDIYVYQGEIIFSGSSVTASGEVSAMGLVLDAGASAVTCNAWRGLNVTLRGAGAPAGAHGIMVNAESGTVADGIRFMCDGTSMTTAIRIGNGSYLNAPANFVGFPEADTGPITAAGGATHSGTVVKIACKVGSATYYMLASTTIS